MTIPVNSETYQYMICLQGIHNDPEWPNTITAGEVVDTLKKINECGHKITQSWYFSHCSPENLRDRLQHLFNDLLIKLYPELEVDESRRIVHQDSITFYDEGDFTEPHRDGQNQGRICVLLVYLTPEEDYSNGGGHLEISVSEDNKDFITVKPVRGNVVILDFNNHNIYHGVEKVTNGFKRYCFLSFVSNNDKLPEYLKREEKK